MFASSLLRGLPTRVTALLQDPLHTSWKQVRQHCFPQDHCLLSKCRKAFTTLKKKERDRLGKAAFDNMSKTQREFSRQHAIATALQAEPIHTPGSRKRRYYDSQPPTARQTISPQWTSEPMVIDLVPTTSPDVLRGDESWAMSDDSMEVCSVRYRMRHTPLTDDHARSSTTILSWTSGSVTTAPSLSWRMHGIRGTHQCPECLYYAVHRQPQDTHRSVLWRCAKTSPSRPTLSPMSSRVPVSTSTTTARRPVRE